MGTAGVAYLRTRVKCRVGKNVQSGIFRGNAQRERDK